MKTNKFTTFESVLVRDNNNQEWKADFYSHYDERNNTHQCVSCNCIQCIPYNEETAHLIGTNQPYKEPEPKVWKVCGKSYCEEFTDAELLNFITIAAINNKDATYFNVKRIR